MDVDYDELALAQQLLDRQAEVHCTAMVTYVRQYCAIPAADLGLVLQALHPLADLSVTLGSTAFDLAGRLARASSAAVSASVAEYVAADREATEAFNALATTLGASPAAFVDPRDSSPQLGGANSQAGAEYGKPEGWMFDQAADEGAELGGFAKDAISQVGERAGGWVGGSGGVAERNDASSYLVAPVAGNAAIEELRWSAGPILGGVDWVFEQFFHFSLLEDVIMKPLAGNWQAIDEASIAWSNLGRASMEIGENYSALPDQTATWLGEAAEHFRLAMAGLSAAMVGLRYACDYVSGLVGTISTIAAAGAAVIGAILNQIAFKLLRMAAEAAIPIAGWVALAGEIVVMIYEIIVNLRTVYTIVNLIFDAIYDFIESKERLVEVAFVIEDLVEYLGKTTVRSVAA